MVEFSDWSHLPKEFRKSGPLTVTPESWSPVSNFSEAWGKSIIFGRFIGPVRPVVPLIAGHDEHASRLIFHLQFLSALAWAPFTCYQDIWWSITAVGHPPSPALLGQHDHRADLHCRHSVAVLHLKRASNTKALSSSAGTLDATLQSNAPVLAAIEQPTFRSKREFHLILNAFDRHCRAICPAQPGRGSHTLAHQVRSLSPQFLPGTPSSLAGPLFCCPHTGR